MPQRHDQGVKKRMSRTGDGRKKNSISQKKQARRARNNKAQQRWWAEYIQAESQRRAWPEGKEA